jgi:hypothetical protein
MEEPKPTDEVRPDILPSKIPIEIRDDTNFGDISFLLLLALFFLLCASFVVVSIH